MAKVKIAGNAAVVVSSVKKEAFELAAKYRPDALVLKGGKDGTEALFCVAFAKSGNGSVTKYGIEFDATTCDADGFATVTTLISAPQSGVEDFVADKYGAAILNLNKIEAAMEDVLEDIEAEKAEILGNIEVL